MEQLQLLFPFLRSWGFLTFRFRFLFVPWQLVFVLELVLLLGRGRGAGAAERRAQVAAHRWLGLWRRVAALRCVTVGHSCSLIAVYVWCRLRLTIIF